MAEQQDLFGGVRSDLKPEPAPKSAPFQPHSPTSLAAAVEIAPKLNRLQEKVLAVLRTEGRYGLTDEEMQILLGMNPSTQRPRRIELWRKGLIHEEGARKTHSGRLAAVWIITEKGGPNDTR